MFDIYLPAVAAYLACASSLALTNYVRGLAERFDFVDKPDGRRKTQEKAVALGGGVAILLSCAITLGVLSCVDFNSHRVSNPSSLMGLGFAAVLLCVVGLLDDLVGMRGVFKLTWQLVAASLIVTTGSGLAIDKLDLFGTTYEIGLIGIPLAMLWIVAAINSLNLIDGMDGLATTVGLIFSVTLGILALTTGSHTSLEAIIAFCMAGALLGFLRHNGPPATIYLGDSGSMLIGVVLGTLSLRCSFKEATATAIVAPLAVWAIPILDSAAALVRRKLTGRSMYSTDRGHIHHRLLTRGLSNRQALLLIAGLCLITSAGAIVSVKIGSPWVGFASAMLVVILLVGTRAFGHSELILLNNRLVGFGRSLFTSGLPRSSSVRLQGTLDWESVWQGLIETALRNNYVRMRLNLFLPQYHEDFYASWQRETDAVSRWSSQVPLVLASQQIGTLKVEGLCEEPLTVLLAEFADVVDQLEAQLHTIVEQERGRRQERADLSARPLGASTGGPADDAPRNAAPVGKAVDRKPGAPEPAAGEGAANGHLATNKSTNSITIAGAAAKE